MTLLAFTSCATDEEVVEGTDLPGTDLSLGDLSDADAKADGDWGHALECKPVPNLPPLVSPEITLSIDGLTLHLVDKAGGYDRVFPVGPGTIDDVPTEPEFGESRSYYPIIKTGKQDFAITPSTIQPCKTWWTDPATQQKIPVFAGLPFLSWYGNYAIHGPIDNYRAANGGTLRRGYVSHGCFRMQAADILEVYARIKGVARVPVHVQREREKKPDGKIVDLDAKWIGSQCSADTDCNFTGGFCSQNAYSRTGFCSARCTTYCSDRAGAPPTFCVDDPAAAGKGMCVPKATSTNFGCRPYDHFAVALSTPRRGQPTVVADVCKPASPGWVGDHCFADSDCGTGTTCKGATALAPGICSSSCTSFCADQPGWADTFCGAVPALGTGGNCVRRCTKSTNGPECPADMTCGAIARNGSPSIIRDVCLPATR